MIKYSTYHDNELLQLLSESDKAAFTEIYNRYWKMLYAIAYNHLKSTESAEDTVHEVFTSLWKNRQSIHVLSLNNYLASAIKYIVFAHIRKKSYEKEYQKINTHTHDSLNIEDSYFCKELLAFTHNEIETLPPKCRLVFKYSREMGMSNREIADVMEISKKTVENQLNKALNHLRFSLKRIRLFCMGIFFSL